MIVDDSADDAALIAHAIDAAGVTCTWHRVATSGEYAAALRDREWSAVIYGGALSTFPVTSALKRLRKADLDLPLVVVDRGISEETAADLLRAGVRDVMCRGNLVRLMPVLEREITQAEARSEQRKAATALHKSEKRFRDFADTASDGLWETDAAHRFIYFSKQGQRAFGVARAAVIGRPRWAVVGAAGDEPEWRQHCADLAARRPFRNFRYAAEAASGRTLYFSVNGDPIFDSSGTFTGYRGSATDVTAEITATRGETAARNRLLDAVEALSDGFALFDADDRLVLSNSKFHALPDGIPIEEMGMPYETILRKGILPRFDGSGEQGDGEAWLAWRMDRHRNPQGPIEIKAHTGNWLRVQENRTREGGIVLIRTDVTDLKQAQDHLLQANDRLEQVLESISDGFYALDLDWRFTYLNGAAERMFRRPKEELLGRSHREEYPPARNPMFFAEFQKARETGAMTEFVEYSASLQTWFEVRCYPHAEGVTVYFRDATARRQKSELAKHQQEELRSTLEVNQAIIRNSPDIICTTDGTGLLLTINPACLELLGYPAEELVGRSYNDLIHSDDRARTAAVRASAIGGRLVKDFECRCIRNDGSVIHILWSAAWSKSEQTLFMIGRDLTERLATEERQRQMQKMEVVGNLTGGIAHDFNNLLAVVIGNLDLLHEQLENIPDLLELAEEARRAALRGAELTAGLLAFARKQPLQSRLLDVNEVVGQANKLLGRALGDDFPLSLDLASELWPVQSDFGRIETCLLNLAINARDAMPHGGTVTIETRNVQLDEDYAAANVGVTVGDYVLLSVSDTGEGMSAEVLARAFEPFFTTKEPGKGTGLGLSMVFGFARQSGGSVNIYSEPAKGTCVKLYLPRATGFAEDSSRLALESEIVAANGELILVVEDSQQLRVLVLRQLEGLGYRTIEAADAPAALAILEQRQDIDLVFTDVIMPGELNGAALSREVSLRWPCVKVLLTSGFPNRALDQRENIPEGLTFLTKPYRRTELARAIRKALARET